MSELSELYKSPVCEVATHAYTHPRLDLVPTLQCMYEIADCRRELEKTFGSLITGHAYPYGRYNDDVVKILDYAGIEYARTTVSSFDFEPQKDLYVFKPSVYHHAEWEKMEQLADEFLALDAKSPAIFYIWGHAYEFDIYNSWDKFELFLKRISGKQDIFYGTNKEVLLGE